MVLFRDGQFVDFIPTICRLLFVNQGPFREPRNDYDKVASLPQGSWHSHDPESTVARNLWEHNVIPQISSVVHLRMRLQVYHFFLSNQWIS